MENWERSKSVMAATVNALMADNGVDHRVPSGDQKRLTTQLRHCVKVYFLLKLLLKRLLIINESKLANFQGPMYFFLSFPEADLTCERALELNRGRPTQGPYK